MTNILANKIKTPDGTILQSYHRHDYKVYTDANGYTYMVDGGCDYLRRGGSGYEVAPAVELSVYDDSPFDVIRTSMVWGSRGKDGRSPLLYKPISELTTDHIQAILATQTHISTMIRDILNKELNYRKAQYVD